MNKKYLSIFEKYRRRKYHRDLESLQNDLEWRGMTFSGLRVKQEEDLLQDCNDEIEMKKEEIEADIYEQTSLKKERNFSKWTNGLLALVAISGSFLSILTFYQSKQLNRPYITVVQRDRILKHSNNSLGYFLEVRVKNTGNLPSQFKTKLEGWPCPVTARASENDYISPDQEINLGYNLSICIPFDYDLCTLYDNVKLSISYNSPDHKKFDYLTSLKVKNITATDDMIDSRSSSTLKYDISTLGCRPDPNLVMVWYVNEMK